MTGRRWWLSIALMWVAAGAVVAYVLGVENDALGSIGWVAPDASDLRTAGVAFAGGLLAFALMASGLGRVGRGSPNAQVISVTAQASPGVLLAGAITAGVTEEIVFRGFGIERLGTAIGSYGWAGVVTLVPFTLGHLPLWGWRTTAAILGPGAAFTWLYVATRNLPVCIAAHIANDVWAFLVAPRVFARTRFAGRAQGELT